MGQGWKTDKNWKKLLQSRNLVFSNNMPFICQTAYQIFI